MDLPTPGQSFAWRVSHGRPALVCLPLLRIADHLFTTSAWTLGSRPGPADEREGWSEVAGALDLPPARMARGRQVHGNQVIVGAAADVRGTLPQGDIIVAGEPGLAAAVQVADCVPMLVADAATGVVAAVHAGWRGMMNRAPGVAIAALTRAYGTRPADLHVALGPSIGACCYEVGPEVRDAAAAAGFSGDQIERWFAESPVADRVNRSMPRLAARTTRRDRWFFDGWSAIRAQVIEAGVPEGQVHSAALCTASHPGVFCSYRRDGAAAGRLVGAIRRGPQLGGG